jgi:hypothetical protein
MHNQFKLKYNFRVWKGRTTTFCIFCSVFRTVFKPQYRTIDFFELEGYNVNSLKPRMHI